MRVSRRKFLRKSELRSLSRKSAPVEVKWTQRFVCRTGLRVRRLVAGSRFTECRGSWRSLALSLVRRDIDRDAYSSLARRGPTSLTPSCAELPAASYAQIREDTSDDRVNSPHGARGPHGVGPAQGGAQQARFRGQEQVRKRRGFDRESCGEGRCAAAQHAPQSALVLLGASGRS